MNTSFWGSLLRRPFTRLLILLFLTHAGFCVAQEQEDCIEKGFGLISGNRENEVPQLQPKLQALLEKGTNIEKSEKTTACQCLLATACRVRKKLKKARFWINLAGLSTSVQNPLIRFHYLYERGKIE
jgi:hypothetical protein